MNNNPNEIKYISHLLLEKLKSPSNNDSQCDSHLDECDTPHNIDHDKYCTEELLELCKKYPQQQQFSATVLQS